ncbi:MAG: class I SAM-dependent methyltransferase [Nitrospirae bacterium]|nr:class I SAM-dependent methyltransferase [Nitrospirota bacterium]
MIDPSKNLRTGMRPKGKTLSVNDIMEHLRKEIKRKQEEGFYTRDEGKEFLEHSAALMRDVKEKMDELIGIINQIWDPTVDREITSHRPYIGKLIVLAKKIIRAFSRPVFKVMLQGQKELNQHLVKLMTVLINYLNPSLQSIRDNIKDLMGSYEELGIKYLDTIKSHNELYKSHLNILDSFNIQQRKLEEVLTGINRIQDTRYRMQDTKLKTEAPSFHLDDKSYLLFEERYRGSKEDVKEKQRIYIDYLKGSEKVLDIGCGRGEFLELLREGGIDSYGIDTNEIMVSLCKEKGLKVIKGDGVDHLRSLEDDSLGGVFAAQVVEHLETEDLIEIIRLTHSKLKTGATFIAETINPLCLTTFSGPFYLDLTHIKPIHPQALVFLIEMAGFRNVEIKYTSPYPEEMKLQQVDFFHKLKKFEDAFLNIVNNNINRLNELLYGYQEYAVIGKK